MLYRLHRLYTTNIAIVAMRIMRKAGFCLKFILKYTGVFDSICHKSSYLFFYFYIIKYKQ